MADVMAEKLIDGRVRGKSYSALEQQYGIPAEEIRAIVQEELLRTRPEDTIEARLIVQRRLESIVDGLWDGLADGSFNHAKEISKATEQLAILLDLNEQTIKQQITIISDEETQQLLRVLTLFGAALYSRVAALPLPDEARAQLTQWTEWTAEASTEAVEQALYAEIEEEK